MPAIPNGSPASKAGIIPATVRDARIADLPAIVAIHNAAISSRLATAQLEPVTVEGRKDWFGAHTPEQYPLLVSEIEGTIAGWLSSKEFLPRCAYRGTVELSVYVSERFRRHGIGRQLLREMIGRASTLEIHSLVGLIFADNDASIALFRDVGFERWGLLPAVARMDDQTRDLTIFGRKI